MDYSKLYYKCQRPELVRHIKKGKNRILDVGCAEGFLGESLKSNGFASEVVGIELFSDAANVAKNKLDHVICGDIEQINRSETGLESGAFDYIICGDVLEHLKDPWDVLTWLVELLDENGRIIVSLPNVRHWSVLVPLLFKGEWDYQSHGIMDKTHLRFFTGKNAKKMFDECGLTVELIEGGKLRRKKDKVINLSTLGLAKEFVTVQWTLVGKRKKSNKEVWG